MTVAAPYGTWQSPVSAIDASAQSGHPDWLGTVGAETWWTEPRPSENGRCTLVRRHPDGRTEDALPAPWNVRTRVMEYGGAPWTGQVGKQGPEIVFTHFADQRLYRVIPDTAPAVPVPLTPNPTESAALRYVDPIMVGDYVWCVRETHHGPDSAAVSRDLVAVPLDGSAAADPSAVEVLVADRHFITGPRLSPDCRRVAWIGWDHPAMPWDGTELRVADIGPDGSFGAPRTVAGGPEEPICQVEWANSDELLFSGECDGWWNLHRLDLTTGAVMALHTAEEEFGGPLWQVGCRWFAPLSDGRIAVVHGRGTTHLGFLDPADATLTDVPGPWTEWAPTLAVPADGSRVVACGAGPARSYEVVEIRPGTGCAVPSAEVIGHPHTDSVDPAYLSEPYARTFTGPGGREVHAIVHPPRNPDYTGPEHALPPYVVFVHGGPTSRSSMVLSLSIAYFTSRGVGVLDVNYGGSTGFGRAYRERLRGQWGVVDVQDCEAAALGLVAEGLADPNRLGIRGRSAGGWTVGASLVSVPTYRCGTLYYPALDLVAFASGGTHDFESRYLDALVGPLPQAIDQYHDRSPINRTDRLTAPFLLLQGLDDRVCPPEQCERFLVKAAGRGVSHAYLAFEGEGHGFRRLENQIAALEAEFALYAHAFGFYRPGIKAVGWRE
ncbi:prolyl oligopeptidase family serine peptidase [Streptomyces sp. MUM 2J]|uniref:prolyl oligopeptidase family serine peptidase n=1 Tax=Streptomyces sp. MUM 2J TaxID=2791987 RepID=UPI001F03974F|nr:prolyl oligopeptidase family serine peptidase [Streptomyces sp. MUM 2J]MCH0566176.1 S9 family peptidase [Streptomyces sp. MUM 2J]